MTPEHVDRWFIDDDMGLAIVFHPGRLTIIEYDRDQHKARMKVIWDHPVTAEDT